MTTWITICDTCKREGWAETGADETDGVLFARAIEAAAAGIPNIKTRRASCLMGCNRSCNVAIQAQGKLAYTLGEFTPDVESAEGVVAYAALHAQSETGQVPYKTWPTPIKGHFVTRHPPLPDTQ